MYSIFIEYYIGASSTVEEENRKENTIAGDQKICDPKVGKVNGGSLAEKKEERKITNHEKEFESEHCNNIHYAAESSFAALNQGWPSSNFSTISAGNDASLCGFWKRSRDQRSGGLQRRPRAHTSLIQDSLRAIACLKNEPRETETRY